MYKYIIFILAILNIIGTNLGLVKFSPVEDNAILKTESAIRSTVNNIFSTFKIRDTKSNSKLKQSSLVHNYFASITLHDYNNLREIANLSRVDKKNIDNGTESFIALLNNVLDEAKEENITNSNNNTTTDNKDNQLEDVVDFITDYVKKLEYLKYFYAVHNPNFDVNQQILKVIRNDNDVNFTKHFEMNKTEDNNVLDENEYWEQSGRRVYRGKFTKIRYFPFMASVQFFNKFQCAGSIIKDDLVITAASCLQLAWNNRFYRENPSFLSVRVGSSFYEGGGENVGVQEIYFHPGYNPKNLWHNLAIMRLVRQLKFKRSRVKKIDFDRRDEKLPFNTDGITILGWGAKLAGNTIHKPWEHKLSFAILDAYPLEDCQEIYSREYVTSKHFCAGFISRGGGACNRDVGGPGIVDGILTGVISFGSPVCGTPDAPTVFTKVGFYTDWIEEIMEQAVPMTLKKTTTASPFHPYPKPLFHITQKPTTFKIEPMVKMKPVPLYPTTEQPIERDGKLFKEFLKTMFSSKEVNDYIDRDVKGKVKMTMQRKKTVEQETATEALVADELTTNMGDVDPETVKSESDTSEEMLTKKPIEPVIDTAVDLLEDSVDDLNEEPLNDEQTITDKELENDIIKLIEETDFGNINVAKTETKVETNESKEEVLNKIDDSILTLLYLSDSEKGNNNLKIPIDKNDESKLSNEDLLNIELGEESDDDEEEEGIVIATEAPPDGFKDFTYRNNGTKVDLLTKNVLYDILSAAIQGQDKNPKET